MSEPLRTPDRKDHKGGNPVREPSEYELKAWAKIQQFKGRPLTRAARSTSQQVAKGAAQFGKRASDYFDDHPRTQSVVSRGQASVAKGVRKVGTGTRKAVEALPAGVTEWGGEALDVVTKTVGRISRVGLSPKKVVARHRKLGHDVETLFDLGRLDLQQIDAVRGRGAGLSYPAVAALSGAGAGLVISGGELVLVASAGASAAPSVGAIAGAMAADAATVLGLASRSVGHIALLYGYDPEEPGEKLFVMSVVNAGTAMSASAKTAAMSDISRLTQALARGKAWAVLDKSVVARVAKQFASRFTARLTKRSLGKIVPTVGIVVGGVFNWSTLESIVDAADIAYRQRFLLEKYPQLSDAQQFRWSSATVADPSEETDQTISVLNEIAEAGGPDLR